MSGGNAGYVSIAFAVATIFLSFILGRRGVQSKIREEQLERAEKDASQARTEASKATAEKEASKATADLVQKASRHIVQLMRGDDRTDAELSVLHDRLQNARDRNDIDDAIEVARLQAERAVSLGMSELKEKE